MKNTFYLLILFCLFPILFFNCSSDDEEIPEKPEIIYNLRLSIDKKIHYIYSTDTVFNILEGNGEYIAMVSDEDVAKVAIDDTTVHVAFIGNGSVNITITDAKGQTAEAIMNVYHKSLVDTHYILFMEKDSTYVVDHFTFGVGGYHLKNIRGDHAQLTINDDNLKVTAKSHGKTYFDILDKRGTKVNGEVWVVAFYSLDKDKLEIEMIPDQRASIKTLYGQGWEIESYSGPIAEAVIIPVSNVNPSDILQIDSSTEIKGSGIIWLKDKEGNRAAVTVTVM